MDKLEKINNPKQELWNQEVQNVRNFVDKIGGEMDEMIVEPVVSLRMHNFGTESSCEGHIDWGYPYPWIDVCSIERYEKIFKEDQYFSNLYQQVVKYNDENAPTLGDPDFDAYKEYWEIENSLRIIDEVYYKKMNALLEEYFTPMGGTEQYVLNFGRLEPSFIPSNYNELELYLEKLTHVEKKLLLEKSQRVFFGFTNFLKEKYFSS